MSETRTPPYSEEAERGALGAMLLDPLRLIAIARNELKIQPDSFYLPNHQMICAVLFEMMAKQKPLDVLTVAECLRDKEQLERIGGSIALDRLIDDCPTATHGEHYLGIVRQKSILRKAIYLAREVEEGAYKAEKGDEYLAPVSEQFVNIVADVTVAESNADIMAKDMAKWRAANKNIAKDENREPISAMGLPSPWNDLTLMLCGFETGLNIICGRPSEGKTALAGNIINHWLELGIPGAVIEMDISNNRLLARIAHMRAGVSLAKTKQGFANRADLEKVREQQELMAPLPLYLNDWDRDIGSALSWVRAQKMKRGIQWLMIDHLTLLNDSAVRGNFNPHMIYGGICKQIKAASLKMKLSTLLLWQLNRGPASDGRAPEMSDLRETGSGEEDAFTITTVHQDMDVHEEMESQGISTENLRPTWVQVVKNQDGQRGRLPFWFRGAYFKFEQRPWKSKGVPDWDFTPASKEEKKAKKKAASGTNTGEATQNPLGNSEVDNAGENSWRDEFEGLGAGQ